MMMLKYWLVAFLGMAVIWGMAPAAQNTQSPKPDITTPHVIRFRVIANSDNPVDQALKLDVRDAVLEKMDPVLNGVKSRQLAAARIKAMEPALSRIANQVLKSHHVAYRARVEWTKTEFPTKAYGSWVLPAGRYQALLIVLGHGAGHNWWCVLFPSLCFIDMGNALAVPQSSAAPASTEATAPTPGVAPATASPSPAPTTSVSHSHHPSRTPGAIQVKWQTPHFLISLLAILAR
ncbi:stage II sporulation protein R [Sulfobacillus harzensis]|uniref:Stage II sporulation protein R n=1 Tax=Sulfobacillus harzensis TaxID=2729629 RepID=A0A7Y0L1M4_9FIRM|nr:stage II sporulation protein R [Sulfobacillus harzensis]NMP21627.1 stage II sporulation protein R [Sulfobacillus harzensis]